MTWFRKQKFINGALDDPRIREEKLKDFRFEELVTAPPLIDWTEKPKEKWRSYPVRNQNGAGSCVSYSKALELGILNELEEEEFVLLSARDVYTRRSNQGSAGMWGQDANQICIKDGATLETLMPSDNKNETEINKTDDRKPHKEVVGKIFRAKNWIALPFEMNSIASILKTGKGVNLFFKFNYSEWNRPVPVLSNQVLDCHHSVVAIDYTWYNGKRALIIQDSWGLKNTYEGRRVISEDWLNPVFRRINWASYFEDLCNWDLLKKEDLTKPKWRFEKDLWFGLKNNDVIMLQDALKWLDLFPKTQISTGFFGGITRDSVKKFQIKYGIEPVEGYVGKITRARLNEIFSP